VIALLRLQYVACPAARLRVQYCDCTTALAVLWLQGRAEGLIRFCPQIPAY